MEVKCPYVSKFIKGSHKRVFSFALSLPKISMVEIICIGTNRNHEQPPFTNT